MVIDKSLHQFPTQNSILENIGSGDFSNLCSKTGPLITEISLSGEVTDGTHLVADLGDVLPFLDFFGHSIFVDEQIKYAFKETRNGVYRDDGYFRLFHNHDWLLGMVELSKLRNDKLLLNTLELAFEDIQKLYNNSGFLLDQPLFSRGLRGWLRSASPFNLGYVELWVELWRVTGDEKYLVAAESEVGAWVSSPSFRKFGYFCRYTVFPFEVDSFVIRYVSRMRARLFKDNTNAVFALVALFDATGSEFVEEALTRWFLSYKANFFCDGRPVSMIGVDGKQYTGGLKEAFSSLDVLLELYRVLQLPEIKEMAKTIVNRTLQTKLAIGVLPSSITSPSSHLDANVDFAVSLALWGDMLSDSGWINEAACLANATVGAHAHNGNLVLSVDERGGVSSDRVIVKYQFLALKLALLNFRDCPDNGRVARELLKDR